MVESVFNSPSNLSVQSRTSSSTGSKTTNTEFSDFREILSTMMLVGSASGQNQMGNMMGLMMAPLMLNLLEKILAEQVAEEPEAAQEAQASAASEEQADSSQAIRSRASFSHINQFEAEVQVGGDGRNANCGPTSLVMALHALGLCVKGETQSTSAGQAVDLARKSMVADASRDGIDSSGRRVEWEHSSFTNFVDLSRGAQAAGARVQTLSPTSNSIQGVLRKGGTVVASGTFVGKSPLPWTGDRGSDNSSAPGGATMHLIAVTGMDASGNFIVHDPARRTQIAVSAQQLDSFMRGNAGAIGIFAS